MRRLSRIEPVRRWVATVTYGDGRALTTTITGPTPEDAARRYAATQAAPCRVVARSEVR